MTYPKVITTTSYNTTTSATYTTTTTTYALRLTTEYDYITEFREAELEIIETLEKLTIKNSDCPKIKEILKVLKKK